MRCSSFFKNDVENEAERLVQGFLCFLRKLYIRLKQIVSTFVLIYFDRPLVRYTINTNFITF